MSDNVLIIFIKSPQVGFVKTRLAKGIGQDGAVKLYRLFVETILARTEDKGFVRFIFYYPYWKKKDIVEWIGCNMALYPQEGLDLGERLSNAFSFSFKRGAKKVIAIGSDCPTIDSEVILKAFRELEEENCVIAPTLDGGYYLVGLNRLYREIFKGIHWSTDRVFRETLSILKKLKIGFKVLEEGFDVDSADDLILLKDILQDISSTKRGQEGITPLMEGLDKIILV